MGYHGDMSSAIAYGLGGLGLDEDAAEWKSYGDKLRADYNKRYGQYMVPGVEQAWNKGKLWDYRITSDRYRCPLYGPSFDWWWPWRRGGWYPRG